MIDFFQVKKTLYPLLSIGITLFIFIGGLAMARSIWGGIFLFCVYVLLCLFGYGSTCIKILPFLLVYLGLFSAIFYLTSGGNLEFVMEMVIRLAGIVIAAIPGMALPPVKLVRNLTNLHFPRLLTLGMLITVSFVPVLASEIRQVRNAMRTRGVISLWNPKILYRAFLIPLIVRVVNISDTLALSVETRGFVSEDNQFTVYHPVKFLRRDMIFAIIFILLFGLGLAFSLMEVSL